MRDRMAAAYGAAMAAAHGPKRVTIHVGQDVWGYLIFINAGLLRDREAAPTLWGFPIFVEKGWDIERIVVRTEEEIH